MRIDGEEVTANLMTSFLATKANDFLVNCPEGELMLAVINRTLEDAIEDNAKKEGGLTVREHFRHYGYYHGEPRQALLDGRFEVLTCAIGLSRAFVRKSLLEVFPWVYA